MDKRYVLFLVSATAVMLLWIGLYPMLFPAPQRPVRPPQNPPQATEPRPDSKPVELTKSPSKRSDHRDSEKVSISDQEAPSEKQKPSVPAQAEKVVAEQKPDPKPETKPRIRLQDDLQIGSLQGDTDFQMRITFTNRGAAIRSTELSGYMDEHRRGPLKLIDPAISPAVDSFLLRLERAGANKAAEEKEDNPALPDLATRLWRVTHHTSEEIEFRTHVAQLGDLELVKRYHLKPGQYQIELAVELHAPDEGAEQTLRYHLQTANGLPLEGEWYAITFREAVVGSPNGNGTIRHGWPAVTVADEKAEPWSKPLIRYAGVDSQYFVVVAAPHQMEGDRWIASGQAILVEHNAQHKEQSDVSFELTSEKLVVAPNQKVAHTYTIFAGPKSPDLLRQTTPEAGLVSLMNYGMTGPVNRLMVQLLRFFYGIVGNWGLAILMLTVVVRGAMFPLTRKQMVSAQRFQMKMQQLQPELKALKEKYKNDKQRFAQAQMELFRKHNINPLASLGGCLPLLIQFPIFIGLYWGLRMAIELRQAPLVPGLGWCSDLSAPDMLLRFPNEVAQFFQGWSGLFAMLNLGPYLNLLPIVTVAVFLIQQKMFMPPPTDDQQAAQQKMMNWVMVLFGLLFYKVPSGLCLYFIASSAWGIAERKLLPVSPAKPSPREDRGPGRTGWWAKLLPNGPAHDGGARPRKKGRPLSGSRR